jgi:hypothetical protein
MAAHPGQTATGEVFAPRGALFDNPTGCLLAEAAFYVSASRRQSRKASSQPGRRRFWMPSSQ